MELMKQAGKAIGGGILGMATGAWQDQRQLKQQERLQRLQIEGQKELGEFNKGLALEMWNDTNYEAQRKHMQNAGLNVGLMYGGSGAGGTTANVAAGNTSGGNAAGGSGEVGMGMQIALQNALQKAQIENIKANTEKQKVEAEKTAGVDTEAVKAGIENLKQSTQNAKMQEGILQYENKIKEVQANIANMTQQDAINAIIAGADIVINNAQITQNSKEASNANLPEVIKQTKLTTAQQMLDLSLTKAGITKTESETKKIAEEIVRMREQTKQGWQSLSNEQKEIEIKKLLQEFSTSDAAKIQQWTKVLTDVTGAYSDWIGSNAKMLDAVIPF